MQKFTDEDFVCICGNYACLEGFFPCLRNGTVVEPVAASNWDGVSYKCIQCGTVWKNPYYNEDGTLLVKEKSICAA